MSVVDMKMIRGDQHKFVFDLWVIDGNVKRSLLPAELTGATIRATAKRSLRDADTAAVFALSSAGVNPQILVNTANSQCTVVVQPTNTASLDSGGETLFFDLQVTDSVGAPHTHYLCRLLVTGDVTKTV